MEKPSLGLYIHIPFCKQKCQYCDFCSWPQRPDSDIIEYVHALCEEIIYRSKSACLHEVDTIYFGGGTPTILPVSAFTIIINTIKEYYDVKNDAEITTECNPATVDEEYLKQLRALGINRLSIGVQSLHDNELKALGRVHSAIQAVQTFKQARKAGFENISVDLMFGIPEQTMDSFSSTLQDIVALGPEHLSVYGLILEEGTPFWDKKETLPIPDEDTERDMYMYACQYLSQQGFAQYEISNFGKVGYRSAHNYRYWDLQEYWGFGISAHSLWDGGRYYHTRNWQEYVNAPCQVKQDEVLTQHGKTEEYLMMRMRLTDGVQPSVFEEKMHESFAPYGRKLESYMQYGLVEKTEDRYRLTVPGFYVSNTILSDLLDFYE